MYPPIGASVNALGSRLCPPSVAMRSVPTRCGRSTFEFDTTADGRLFKICNLVDEHTREALACHVAPSIDADATVSILEAVAAGPRLSEIHPL